MKLNIGQIQSLMRSTGWPENIIVLMSAVAMAESSGDTCGPPGTISPNEFSIGLFQINTLVHHNYTRQQLCDPVINSREGLRVFRLQGLRAWGSYTDGRYRQYMASSRAAYGASPQSIIPTPTQPSSDYVPTDYAPSGGGAESDTTGLLIVGGFLFFAFLLAVRG
jgi:hypothetical protein